MDPYRYGPPGRRYGGSHDSSLLAVFLLTILLMAGVVAALTAGTVWQPPELPNILPQERRSGGLFGANVLENPPGVATASPQPTATPAAVVVPPSPTVPPATPSAQPTPSATPEPPKHYVVGNTGGVGVWLRRSPRLNDYLIAWPDNTRMEVVGPDVQGEGRTWRNVRDPRGHSGFIPAEWLLPVR